MKITLKMSGSTSPEPLLILLKGAENLSLNRQDKKNKTINVSKANAYMPNVV